MPLHRKKNNRVENNFLQENPNYHLEYTILRKEARVWNNSAQYWMGQEATRRAECLLRGDIDGYKEVKHSHALYYPHSF